MSHYTVNYVDSFRGEVTFSGIPDGAIDRTGHCAIWRVVTMFQAARIELYRAGNMFSMQELVTNDLLLFLVRQTIRLKPDIHRMVLSAEHIPFTFELTLQNVRNSSFQFVQKLYHGLTNKFLGESVISMVSVDKCSRRSRTLPDWFKEKYKEYQTDDKPTREGFPATPDDAFSCQVIPHHTDMDENKHVNQLNYIKYCINCSADAALSGYYRHYNEDISQYPVLEIDLFYMGESVLGDKLSVMTWQGEYFNQIYFSLTKNEKEILRSRFLFGRSKSTNESSLKSDSKL